MTEGIKQLTKKNMHDVSNAINILDTSGDTDKGICKDAYATSGSQTGEVEGLCGIKNSTDQNSSRKTGLKALWEKNDSSTKGGGYAKDSTAMGEATSAKISKDVSSNLNREQKGVVSSAFAKAHEGAEIVEIRSISTTSVMVNACYDVLPVSLMVS